ncbi:hypothetical protein [Candidatus Accumulibacter sp. ACC012]|uniref:hypothetical protein n=1 Tax=Candidatus Accumulibacter sp. ACC012 TaxID=2823332 RepID=UPI0034447F2C
MFREAESGNAILFFDEADALFAANVRKSRMPMNRYAKYRNRLPPAEDGAA